MRACVACFSALSLPALQRRHRASPHEDWGSAPPGSISFPIHMAGTAGCGSAAARKPAWRSVVIHRDRGVFCAPPITPTLEGRRMWRCAALGFPDRMDGPASFHAGERHMKRLPARRYRCGPAAGSKAAGQTRPLFVRAGAIWPPSCAPCLTPCPPAHYGPRLDALRRAVAIVAQLVRALVCGTRGHGFEPRRSPHFRHLWVVWLGEADPG